MTKSLAFNKTNFNIVERSGQPWLTSADIAAALSYKSIKSITNLFNENKDEFTDSMTLVIDSMTNGINGSTRRMKVRIFSLRGAHLLAMFARTTLAKEFRRWVLDILDKEVEKPKQSSTDERTGLRNAVNLLVSKKGLMYPDAYSMIHHRFNVEHLDELTKDQLPQAVEYIHRLALEGEYLPAAKVPELSIKPQFTDEELNHLAWLWRVSEIMLKGITEIYPLLAVAEHKLAPSFLNWKREYPYTLKRAQRHLIRETLHIPVIKGGDPVLLHLRDQREIN